MQQELLCGRGLYFNWAVSIFVDNLLNMRQHAAETPIALTKWKRWIFLDVVASNSVIFFIQF